MNILISGAAGFVGSHLCDYLIENGHTIIGIDNLSTGDMKNVHPKVDFHYLDIFHEPKRISLLLKDYKPDWVFHEAAQCRTQLSVDDPLQNHDTNITGTLNMLLAACAAEVKRFIFASSCIVYAPNTPYYVSKLAGEEYCKVFHKLYGLSTISLRYSNVYGSLRQSEKGSHVNAIASLHKSKRETGRLWITGDGLQTRDWSHVTDVCRANLLAAQSDINGVFDISTGVSTSMNEIAKYFDCPIDYVPDRLGDAKHLSEQQTPIPAELAFGYKAEILLGLESMKPYL